MDVLMFVGQSALPYVLPDLDSLRLQSEEGARMGFTGKQVIHPDQVPVVQEAFLPSPQQVDWAQGLVLAFHEHQSSGKVRGHEKGLDAKMVGRRYVAEEVLVMGLAQRVLD